MPTPSTIHRELQIGPVSIGFPVVQAALSGYSDMAMRVVSRRQGAAYALCEVVLDKLVLQAGRKTWRRFMQIHPEEHPVGGQLMGNDPDEFAAAARELVHAGFDVIDINFGCPVRKVLGRCRGGFLLGQPDRALQIVRRVREVVPAGLPVTVKMRRGVDDSPTSREQFFQILSGAFHEGIAAATVHGRTVQQRYVGPSRWEFLREVKERFADRTIIGSGDLFDAQACVDMLANTGIDGVSVARGAIGNPWIFSQVKALLHGEPLPLPPSLFEQRAVIEEHYRLARHIYGDSLFGRQMRKFGIKYARCHPQPLAVRDAFIRVKHTEELERVLETYYREDLPGKFPDIQAECNDQPEEDCLDDSPMASGKGCPRR